MPHPTRKRPLLLADFHFGSAADGWNSCSPPIAYAPIASWPSGEVSFALPFLTIAFTVPAGEVRRFQPFVRAQSIH